MSSNITEDILIFLYKLQNENIYLWLNQNKNLQLYSDSEISEDIINTLKINKNSIVEFLNFNKVYSKPDYPFIYRCYNKEKKYPLSFAQERLIFIDKFEQGTNVYNIPMLLKTEKTIDVNLLKKSFNTILEKHNILKSIYLFQDNNFYQKVSDEIFSIPEKTIYSDDEFDDSLNNFFNSVFDLENELPVKLKLFHKYSSVYLALLFHHIAFDGWSAEILVREIQEVYNQLNNSSDNFDNSKNIQYSDFALWQKYSVDTLTNQENFNYWKQYLEGFSHLNFPIDKQRPVKYNYAGDYVNFRIPDSITNSLTKLAKQNNTTLYCVMLSAYYILLNKYTDQNDIILGIPVANRTLPQLENLIGFFVNSLPIRQIFDCSETIESLIKKMNKNLINSLQFQETPFEKMLDELKIERDVSRNPIFQIMFVFEPSINFVNKNIKSINIQKFFKYAKFDLTLSISTEKESLSGTFNYANTLFHENTIKQLSRHYLNILNYYTENSKIKISDINILSEQEYNKIIYEWNQDETNYPIDKTIHQLFEEQVEKTPDNIAVVFEDRSYSYSDLSILTNSIGLILRNSGIKPDTIVPIITSRNEYIIIGGLSIIKAGGCFVYIDPTLPDERIEYLLKDYNTITLLIDKENKQNHYNISNIKNIFIFEELLSSKTTIKKLDNINLNSDLFAIITTSGSTGVPKGSMIEHRNFINFAYYYNELTETHSGDSIASYSSFSFDVSLATNFAPLLAGATVNIVPEKLRYDITLLNTFFIKKSIKITFLPTIIGEFYIKEIKKTPLKIMAIGGEQLGSYYKREYRIINAYAPSECTVAVIMGDIDEKYKDRIPLGITQPNNKIYILNKKLCPVPVGVAGELFIGGIQVGRGYYNKPELNRMKFIQHEKFGRLFETGDLAKWTPDGQIVYLNRTDDQIKISGFRIELGEIEAKLIEHENIYSCKIIVNEQSLANKTLIAYYTLSETGKIKNETLKQNNLNPCFELEKEFKSYLKSKIPAYMVPNFFIKLEKMPYNRNGKIDKKELPKLDTNLKDKFYIPPTTDSEKKIIEIWRNILGTNKIGIDDNFFHLGGTSMLAIKISHLMSTKFNTHIPVAQIFLRPTIREISDFIDNEFNNSKDNENWEF